MDYEEKYKKALDRAVNLFVTNNISATAACKIFPELNKSEEINYERKYKKALEWMRSVYDSLHGATKEDAEHYFPELKESKSERVRKGLIETISSLLKNTVLYHTDITKEEALAWLEKQGEKKPTDEVEPKFKVGDWITDGDYIWKIVEVEPLDYILQSQDGDIVDDTISYVDKQFHSFTIKDAKDGDVLVDSYSKDSLIILYKGINKEQSILAHCGWNGYNFSIKTNGLGYGGLDNTNYLPATKEQRDLLFQKMKEAGYEWDGDKENFRT